MIEKIVNRFKNSWEIPTGSNYANDWNLWLETIAQFEEGEDWTVRARAIDQVVNTTAEEWIIEQAEFLYQRVNLNLFNDLGNLKSAPHSFAHLMLLLKLVFYSEFHALDRMDDYYEITGENQPNTKEIISLDKRLTQINALILYDKGIGPYISHSDISLNPSENEIIEWLQRKEIIHLRSVDEIDLRKATRLVSAAAKVSAIRSIIISQTAVFLSPQITHVSVLTRSNRTIRPIRSGSGARPTMQEFNHS